MGVTFFSNRALLVECGTVHHFGGIDLRLPTPEDLIVFKAVAHRPKDLLDIEGIEPRYPNLDKQRIEHWVRAFAETLGMPELWLDIAPLVGGHD